MRRVGLLFVLGGVKVIEHPSNRRGMESEAAEIAKDGKEALCVLFGKLDMDLEVPGEQAVGDLVAVEQTC